EEARGYFHTLEYDKAIPYTEALLKRASPTADQRVEAYFLLASARAFVTDPLEAEQPLRFLLRLKPDFDVPNDTSPKLVAVFRKVQVEERAFAAQTKAIERKRLIDRVKLTGGAPAEQKGGKPLTFRYRLLDPFGAVQSLRLPYRTGESGDFSS